MKELIQVGRIAAVKVPEDATDFEMKGYRLIYYPKDNSCLYSVKLPFKGKLLGRALELTEEQKEMCVVEEKVDIENKFGNELLAYPDYENKGCYVLSANESYTSLLEAHQIDNNYILILNKEG
jgi:hypothetical protein